jgi:hypothetical protein
MLLKRESRYSNPKEFSTRLTYKGCPIFQIIEWNICSKNELGKSWLYIYIYVISI